MALKDWKKTGKDDWHKFYHKGKKPSPPAKFYDGIFIVKAVDDRYYVNSFYSSTFPTKSFKTKSQALRYAKSYMRTH